MLNAPPIRRRRKKADRCASNSAARARRGIAHGRIAVARRASNCQSETETLSHARRSFKRRDRPVPEERVVRCGEPGRASAKQSADACARRYRIVGVGNVGRDRFADQAAGDTGADHLRGHARHARLQVRFIGGFEHNLMGAPIFQLVGDSGTRVFVGEGNDVGTVQVGECNAQQISRCADVIGQHRRLRARRRTCAQRRRASVAWR
jgi:hypothetical protein